MQRSFTSEQGKRASSIKMSSPGASSVRATRCRPFAADQRSATVSSRNRWKYASRAFNPRAPRLKSRVSRNVIRPRDRNMAFLRMGCDPEWFNSLMHAPAVTVPPPRRSDFLANIRFFDKGQVHLPSSMDRQTCKFTISVLLATSFLYQTLALPISGYGEGVKLSPPLPKRLLSTDSSFHESLSPLVAFLLSSPVRDRAFFCA